MFQHTNQQKQSTLSSIVKRRSTTGDVGPPQREQAVESEEEDYVPFPETRRHSMCGKPPNKKFLISSFSSTNSKESRSETKRPSLLMVLKGSHEEEQAADTYSLNHSGSNSSKDQEDEDNEHESWAFSDEINNQTELFNRNSMNAKIEEFKRKHSDSSSDIPRHNSLDKNLHMLGHEDSKPKPTKTKTRPQRRKSITLGESIKKLSRDNLFGMVSEDEFDVNSVLWENDDDDLSSNSVTF